MQRLPLKSLPPKTKRCNMSFSARYLLNMQLLAYPQNQDKGSSSPRLEINGGDIYKDPFDGNRSTFYYRVGDVQDIISNNIKGKNLLFNKLSKKSR